MQITTSATFFMKKLKGLMGIRNWRDKKIRGASHEAETLLYY